MKPTTLLAYIGSSLALLLLGFLMGLKSAALLSSESAYQERVVKQLQDITQAKKNLEKLLQPTYYTHNLQRLFAQVSEEKQVLANSPAVTPKGPLAAERKHALQMLRTIHFRLLELEEMAIYTLLYYREPVRWLMYTLTGAAAAVGIGVFVFCIASALKNS